MGGVRYKYVNACLPPFTARPGEEGSGGKGVCAVEGGVGVVVGGRGG